MKLYTELLEGHSWVSGDTWKAAIKWLIWHHDGEYVPAPAVIVETCRTEHRAAAAAANTDAVFALMKPDDVPITDAGNQNVSRIKSMTRAQFQQAKALHPLHRRLVMLARLAGYGMPLPSNGLTDHGRDWVCGEYQRARDWFRAHGTLDEFTPGKPGLLAAVTPVPPPVAAEESASGPIWPGARA